MLGYAIAAVTTAALLQLAPELFPIQEMVDYVPLPYMDEFFHVRQTQQYCSRNWSAWDPMITTLPGTYIHNVALLWIVSVINNQSIESICHTAVLRVMNGTFFLMANYVVIWSILKFRNKEVNDVGVVVSAGIISLFPLLYFFYFLYYTDSASVFYVLLSYYLSLTRRQFLSAAVGVFAVFCRQTNIVWVALFATLQLVALYDERNKTSYYDGIQGDFDLKAVLSIMKFLLLNISVVIRRVWPFIGVGALFTAFLWFNEGIVVGDRSNHEASLHFPQVFYFAAFAIAFLAPLVLAYASILDFVKKINVLSVVAFAGACGVGVAAVHFFTLEHKYLLADNRHYTFYLWKNVYRRNDWIKYVLVPAYILSIALLWRAVRKFRSAIWCILFSGCLSLVVVPAKLLEFRYFLIPYLLIRLQFPAKIGWHLAWEGLVYLLVNYVTLKAFIELPFKWPGELDATQRFMW